MFEEQEARERELMGLMDSESRAYEREVKYQIEERERREWEENEMVKWESVLEKNREEWIKRTTEQTKVSFLFCI
jgi:hypothetical protein